MSDRTEFDLVEGFPTQKVVEIAMNDEALNEQNGSVVRNNWLFAVGQEAIGRVAAEQSMDTQPSVVRGVKLYSVTSLQVNPNVAYSRLYQTGRGMRQARRIANDVIQSGYERRFHELTIESLREMEEGSPGLNIFLGALTRSLCLVEQRSMRDAQHMLYGAALMRHVHLAGERAMTQKWWRG